MLKKYMPVFLWVVMFQLVSAFVGLAMKGDISGWYAAMNRPPLTPPNMVFPLVWPALYVLIAVAGWRILHGADAALSRLFIGYITMNWLWTFIFFTLHLKLPAFLWIVVINIIALLIIEGAWKRDRTAALLMIPPLCWTVFAAYLNFGFWWLNYP